MFYFFFKFFKKTYKVIVSLLLVVSFFFFYNIYLVDHSLINLKIALNNLAQAQTLEDFEKIKPLLKIPLLKEISKTGISPEYLFSLESIDNMVSGEKIMEQSDDAKFFLKSVISAKEKERGAFRSFFDQINSHIYKSRTEISSKEAEAQIKALLVKATAFEADKAVLQEIFYEVGNIYLGMSQFSEAEAYLNKAINTDLKSLLAAKAKFNLALVYKYSGNYDKALACFEELIPVSSEIKLGLSSEYEIADVFYKSKKYTESRDKYAQLANRGEDDSKSSMALLRAGTISLYQLNDFKAALDFFHKFALLNAGKISFYKLNELDEALKYLSELDAKNKEMRMVVRSISNIMCKDLRQQGYRFLEEKKYVQATDNFVKVIRINNYDSRSLVGKALASYWLNQKEDAQNEARRASEISPDDEFILINALFIFINSNNLDEAIKAGEGIVQKRQQAIKSPELYYNLGYAYVLKARIPEATVYFDRAIRLNVEFVFAYNNLGCVLWSLKNYSEAIRKFQEALDRAPTYSDACFNLGIAYFQLNRLEDAYKQFERVLDIDPEYKEALSYLQNIKDTLKYQP